jgi:RimJ/RimL family protein N-acetyltransferase
MSTETTHEPNMSKNDQEIDICAENLQKLTFVKLKFPKIIPLDLIESVKGRTFTPEQFFEYQDAQKNNQNNLLFALVDDQKVIKGYLWAEVNPLDGSLFVNTFSVKKEYWGKGHAIAKVVAFLDELKKKTKAPRVFWITTNEKFFLKHKFKRSKNVLMEYNSD